MFSFAGLFVSKVWKNSCIHSLALSFWTCYYCIKYVASLAVALDFFSFYTSFVCVAIVRCMTMTNAKYNRIKYVLKMFYFRNIFLTHYSLFLQLSLFDTLFLFFSISPPPPTYKYRWLNVIFLWKNCIFICLCSSFLPHINTHKTHSV